VKARNMRRDARVSLCVDDEEPPFSFVVVDGTAEMSTYDPDHLHWAIHIGGRYMGVELQRRTAGATPFPASCSCGLRPTGSAPAKT
jgi:hypothetical protein